MPLGIERFATIISTIEANVAKAGPLDRKKAEEAMNITFQEHFEMQNCQAWAFSMNFIDADVAQAFYLSLGDCWTAGNGGWAKDTSLATKGAITKLYEELLAIKLKVMISDEMKQVASN